MSNSQQIKEYFWMLQVLQSGPITKREIDSRWSRSALNEDGVSTIVDSRFHRHLRAIEKIFGVTVECNKKSNVYEYYIKESESEIGQQHQWYLSGLAIGNTLKECENLRGRILFENIPGGTQFLPTMVDGMQNNLVLSMCYGSFVKEAREFFFHPYAIKVFKQRWYAVGYSSAHPEDEVRVYAFDRILSLKLTKEHFSMPADFDAEEYFSKCYGVTVGNIGPVERIHIRVAKTGVPYLRTLPLHKSQEEIETTDEYSVFEYFLAPNKEFKLELLSRSEEVEVLAPQFLRNEFAKIAAAQNDRYNV